MSEDKALPTYKVFGHLGGLLLLEILFWAAVGGVVLVARNIAPNIDVHYPEHWVALLVAPAGLLLFAGHYRWKRKMMGRWVDAEFGRTIWPGGLPRRSVTRFVLWRTGIAFIGIALLDPVVGMRLEEVEAEGIDVMIALDVSRSMLTEDVGMDRLSLGKRTIERLMDQFDGDRVGLVVFAGDAFVQAPITMDLSAVSLFLDAIDTETIPTQGTAIGWAIDECARSFDTESEAARVVIILTDGENHEDDAVQEALSANQEGVQIHTIGMASEGGGPIPEFDIYGRQRGFKEGPDGQPVVSMLDEALLIGIAEAGDGTYTRAASGYVNIDPVLQAIGSLDGKATAKVTYTAFSHRFANFIGLGLLFLLLEMAWPRVQRGRAGRGLGKLATLLLLFLSAAPAYSQGDKAAAIAGSEAFLSGQFSSADSLFERAGDLSGYESRLAMNRGHAKFRDGDAEGAIRNFQQAAEHAQVSGNLEAQADAWSNIGNCLAEGEQYAEALEAFKQSLRLDHGDEDTRHNFASMMQLLQQQEQQEQEQGEEGEDGDEGEEGEQGEEGEDGDKGEDGEQNDEGEEGDEGEDGEQNDKSEDGEDDKEGEQNEAGQDGEQQQEKDQQVAGQISAQDAERILESLDRQEAVIRAKLQAQENAERRKAAGKSSIEKDW